MFRIASHTFNIVNQYEFANLIYKKNIEEKESRLFLLTCITSLEIIGM